MKSCFKLIAALGVAFLMSVAALAADVTPAGTWKWTQPGRDGGAGFEQTLKLDYQGGQLTGTLLGGQGPMGQMPDVAISDASFKDGVVAFGIKREWNGNSFTVKYEGKLEGDTLKGSSERPSRDGGAPVKRDWAATRTP